MPDLIPVNPMTPIPPAPRTHRDKRRKQSVPLPKDEARHKPDSSETDDRDDEDNQHTIDEYA